MTHAGRRDRGPVLAAGGGSPARDTAAVWPLSDRHRLPHFGRRRGQRGVRQRHLPQGLERAIPPHRPARLDTFLGRLARQTAIDGLRARGRQKRQGSQYALSLEELEDCVIGGGRPEDEADAHLLAEAIGGYLRGLKPEARTAFIERYYYFDPLKEIAARHGLGEAKLKSLLFRTRQGLKLWLEKEGFFV